MTRSLSIYDNEQYLFELAQSFMRSRVIFTAMELKLFDLLLQHSNGLTCSQIGKSLDFYYVENQSRCLEDVLDALTTMNFLERQRRDQETFYHISSFTIDLFYPHQTLLSSIDQEFYSHMPHFYEKNLNPALKQSIQSLMLLRIGKLVDLRNYSQVFIDQISPNADVIILWRQDGRLKEKLHQAFDILPSNSQGLLIVVVPNDRDDEVTLALNLFLNMTSNDYEQIDHSDVYSDKFLQQIGFRTVERLQSSDGLALLLAYK